MKKHSGKMVSHPGDSTSVRVMAHTRKKPARNAQGPAKGLGQLASDAIADNVSAQEMPNEGVLNGLRGPGQSEVNHLAASIGLLNRRRV